jgi:hypothetical protein
MAISLFQTNVELARCDENGCETCDGEVTQSGILTTIELGGKGATRKIGPEIYGIRHRLEVVTVMMDTTPAMDTSLIGRRVRR